MPDRLKQAIFNILGSWYATPGILPALSVADVFAGSGSMGLEALSRGASTCVFYEKERLPLESLRRNIDELGAGFSCEVLSNDAWTMAASDMHKGKFDLIFLDPPYRDTQDSSATGRVFGFLKNDELPDTQLPMVVLHHPAKIPFANASPPDPWVVLDHRTFGTSSVTFFGSRARDTRIATNP